MLEAIARPLRPLTPEADPSKFKILSGVLHADTEPDGRKVLRCTATSAVELLNGDEITNDCVADMAAQVQPGMTVFLNHSYKIPEDIYGSMIGSALVMRTNQFGKPVADLDMSIALDESNPRAVQTFNSIMNGTKMGVSIGAAIGKFEYRDKKAGLDGGVRFLKLSIREVSMVGLPRNPRSWVHGARFALHSMVEPEFSEQLDDALRLLEPTDRYDDGSFNPAVFHSLLRKEHPMPTSADPAEVVEPTAEATPTPETPEAPPADEPSETHAAGEETPETPEVPEATASDTPASGDVSPETVLMALEQAVSELSASRARVAELEASVAALTAERDEARADLHVASEIVETLARLPLGRKAGFVAPIQNFQSKFSGIYDPGFLKLIDERNEGG